MLSGGQVACVCLAVVLMAMVAVVLAAVFSKPSITVPPPVPRIRAPSASSDDGPADRLLLLVMTSAGYEDMVAITNRYYRHPALRQDVDVFYYTFAPTQAQLVRQQDNVISFRGHDSLVPGCLAKTLLVLALFAPVLHRYKYILRLNASTIVDVRAFQALPTPRPYVFASPVVYRIEKGRRDLPMGIKDDRFEGVDFGQGTCLIFSPAAALELLHQEAQGRVDHSGVDDVAIAAALRAANVRPQELRDTLWHVPAYHGDLGALGRDLAQHHASTVFYRNKNSATSDRHMDVEQMGAIAEVLMGRLDAS
jgi:hypothetical protein